MSASTPNGASPRRMIGRQSLAAMSPLSPAARKFRPNNDKLEKEAQRRSLAKESINAPSPFRPQPKGTPRVTAEKTRDQITDMYASCIKLCTENKINQKNSWQLPLIDYMEDVMEVQHGEMTNFQMASCTLDASVKIYSCRVDSIHSEAYKVLGGFGRQEDPEAEAGPRDGADSDDEEADNKKAKRRRAVNTLESNPAALNVKKFDLEFDVDPLFKQTTAAFDEGGARGLLLNHLVTQDEAALIFDSQDSLESDRTPSKTSNEVTEAACRELFQEHAAAVSAASEATICPSLANFTFVGWQPADIDEAEGEEAAPIMPSVIPELNMDINMDHSAYFGGIDSDDEDGGGFDDMGPGTDAGDNDYEEVATSMQRVVVPTGLNLVLDQGETEYTYFTDKHLQHWAGPSHWKFQRKAAEDTQASKVKQAGRQKERFMLDFFGPALDQGAAFATSRAATVLTKATLNKGAADNLLPQDTHYDVARLQRLFCRPRAVVAVRRNAAEVEGTAGQTFYDYNNPGDIGNYCPPMEAGDDGVSDDEEPGFEPMGDFDDDFDTSPGDMNTLPLDDGGDLALIAQPRKVEKISIDYARNAKRVNVKQLKKSMWGELTTIEGKEKGPKETEKMESTQRFSQVVSHVPSKVPAAMAQNLSVPIMFVCLLHLANEKNLKIVNAGNDISDLLVSSN